MATSEKKETIYIDVEDEITGVIDKVRSSQQKIVALVLPKRATVLQSVVNMKLLKRTADEVKKRVVLITSEAGLLPLAGMVGMHVAKTLQSKPAIPAAPTVPDAEVIDESIIDDGEGIDPTLPVGVLAALPPEDDETIEVDDIDEEAVPAVVEKKKFNKKLKVPNFARFRLLIFLGGFLLVLLIVGGVFATMVLPKAQITIKTNTSSLATDMSFTTSASIAALDKDQLRLPGTMKELKKTDSEKVPATGQKDLGEKASGTVKLYNCNKADKLGDVSRTVPAGTGVSSGGLTFILQKDVTVDPSSFTGDTCQHNKPSAAADVTAQNAGDKYNLSERTKSYAVAGYSSMTGDGSAMSGGTSKIVKVVTQSDIDGAKQKIIDRAAATVTDELDKVLVADGLVGITETLDIGAPTLTSAPALNAEAAETTVTSVTVYKMLGVKKDDLKQIVEADASKHIDTGKQVILQNGLDSAVVKMTEKKPNGELQVNLKSLVVAGPQLDAETIKHDIAGKKKGETQSLIKSRPGIRDVEVNYSPFWVFSTPKKTSKITIVFQGSDANNGQ